MLGLFGDFNLVTDVRLFLGADDDLLVDQHVPDRIRGLGALGNPVLDAVGVELVAFFLATAVNSAEVFEVGSPGIAVLVKQ